MNHYPMIQTAGENCLIVYVAEQSGPDVANRIAALLPTLREVFGRYLVDVTPSYNSVLIQYDCLQIDHFQANALLRQALNQPQQSTNLAGKLVELPVFYSEQSGPDLSALAQRAGLSVQEVIDIHQAQEYRVYAIGFAPGFAYLGEVDARIAAPRLATPRKRVPKGAVAIADRQTAVYPAMSPGGWNLVGLCPTPMFNPHSEPHMPVQVGDRVRFVAISQAEFVDLGGDLSQLAGGIS
ncbi:5-oxoprolinase subunit PxpB [Bowmanella pacifica]|uniref:Carboxyltransferase domain-containing protein n=1 Tax=Bowmanella pacifica TaxID=502051 RepID=A0A917YSW0_9ALTE|nr:5-oxoprolinase subunit PxpB [Bowmanella pacifica]GGO64666.1 hypothetical protein GCM10010982_04640 [Bowmanella pacifica]